MKSITLCIIDWNVFHCTHSLVPTAHYLYAAHLSIFADHMNAFIGIRLVYPIKWLQCTVYPWQKIHQTKNCSLLRQKYAVCVLSAV